MRTLTILLFTGPALLCLAASELSDALQKGLLEEEANQNLTAAITAYQSVLTRFGEERKAAATATFRIGECYRKQGKTNEALAQFERVTREFPDQTVLVNLSQKYLAESGRGALAGSGSSVPSASQPVLSAEQARLLRDEIGLVGQQLEATERARENGMAGSADVIGFRRQLLSLQRKLPENASPAKQEVLIKDEIALVQELLNQGQKRVETGQIPPLELVPHKRDLLALQRELLAVQQPATTSSFQTRLNTIVRRAEAADLSSEEDKEIVRLQDMIRNSPDLINAPAGGKGTPLQAAASSGQLEVARFLLANHADVNGSGNNEETPLHIAARNGHKTMVELLLQHGADVNARNKQGYTPLHFAASQGYLAVGQALLDKGADPNAQDNGSQTPLHSAVLARSKGVVELLLSRKAEVNAQDNGGTTALMLAARTRQAALVDFLLDHGADVNLKSKQGQTALNISIEEGVMPITEKLLEHGADPNVPGNYIVNVSDADRGMPLHRAAYVGNVALIELLLKHRTDINGRDSNERTPLHSAIMAQNAPVTELLLSKGADPNLVDAAGQTPLGLAMVLFSREGQPPVTRTETDKRHAIVRALLEHGANPDKVVENSGTPLLFAAKLGDLEVVSALLAKGANVNLKSVDGCTALHVAAANGFTEIMQALLDKGADIDAQDDSGNTPLHYATLRVAKGAVQLLVARGAKLGTPNKDGWSPAGLITANQGYQINFWGIPARNPGGFGGRPGRRVPTGQEKTILEMLNPSDKDSPGKN